MDLYRYDILNKMCSRAMLKRTTCAVPRGLHSSQVDSLSPDLGQMLDENIGVNI